MNDLISRQMALDAIEKAMCENGFRSATGLIHKTTAYDIIRHLPIAQPQRIRGKWDFIGNNQFRCTACKHIFVADWLEEWRTYTYEHTFPDFCPSCGAQME